MGAHIINRTLDIIDLLYQLELACCKSSIDPRNFSKCKLIHPGMLLHIEKLKESDPIYAQNLHQLLIDIHIYPFLTMFINVAITQIVFEAGNVIYSMIYGLFYCFINYLAVQYRGGKPIYDFLHWKDYTTILICLVIMALKAFLFILISKILAKFRLQPEMMSEKQN
ncbi:UNKNOWN [Stylonychia lemnae]|uniref:Uncharacterized protein n=1 Tax=Stylonychia lemnae TaxID=5949 RepID=A0A077ZS78_STYLE|nr:UNKNOWN [Stylonychia lemnae]|eukprot:CDW72364.1 UNKNOWN [Stylonychia lemnae]